VKNPPAGGRFSDYRQTAEGVEGVLRAYLYGPSSFAPDGRRGLGIFDVCITSAGYGGQRLPSQTIVDNVEDAIEAMRPACTRDFQVLVPDISTLYQIEAEITPHPGYEFDWDRVLAFPVFVDSYTAATRTLIVDETAANFSPSGRRGLKVGDRCYLLTGSAGIPANEINTVKSITDNTPVGKCTIVFNDSFFFDPQPGNEFWPAGPLSEPVLIAVSDMLATLGPAKRTLPSGPEWADPEQIWDHILRTDRLVCTMRIDGVLGVDLINPAIDVEPNDPGGTSSPEMIIPGWINIHPAAI
jgi:hypothetical protein